MVLPLVHDFLYYTMKNSQTQRNPFNMIRATFVLVSNSSDTINLFFSMLCSNYSHSKTSTLHIIG